MALQKECETEERHHSLEQSQAKMSQMKAPVTLALTLIIISLTQVKASPSLLERLLESHLKTATCQARCAGLSSEEVEDCLDICSLPESSQTKICQQERFCTGGCRAGCNSDREEETEVRSVGQQDCLLTWQLSQPQHSSLVFLVAGRDQAGMLSLLATSVLETRLELSPATTSKFSQLTVLAVDRRGLADTKTVTLQSVSHCHSSPTEQSRQEQENEDEVEVTVEKIENKSYEAAVYIAVMVSLLILTIFAVAAIIHRRSKNRKTMEEVKTFIASNAFLINQEDFLYNHHYRNNEKYTIF